MLWVIDNVRMGISTPPGNHAVAVRYYNRYFLPAIGYDPFAYHLFNQLGMGRRLAALGLLLWAMSYAGIRPTRRIPVWCEIDHPLGSGGYSGYTVQQRLALLLASTQWLYDYSKQRDIYIVLGISTNHTRDSTWGHYKTLVDYPAESQPIQDILIRAVREGRWFACWHDHSFELGAGASTYTRHSGGMYGTPANVPPWGPATSAIVTLNYQTPLLVHIEDQEIWMQQPRVWRCLVWCAETHQLCQQQLWWVAGAGTDEQAERLAQLSRLAIHAHYHLFALWQLSASWLRACQRCHAS